MVLSLGINSYAGTENHSNTISNGIGNSEDYRLYQNFPNPFNPATIISYKINQGGFVSLKVYNLIGQVVAELVNDHQEPGTYSAKFDASELSAGVYLYKLQINGFTSVKRMTLIK